MHREVPWGAKPSDVNLPMGPLCQNPSWLKDASNIREEPEIYQIQTQKQAKQDDRPKENPEEMIHKSDSNYYEGQTDSVSVSIHTLLKLP